MINNFLLYFFLLNLLILHKSHIGFSVYSSKKPKIHETKRTQLFKYSLETTSHER